MPSSLESEKAMPINIPLDTMMEYGMILKLMPTMMEGMSGDTKSAKKAAKKARKEAKAAAEKQAEAFNNLASSINQMAEAVNKIDERLGKLEVQNRSLHERLKKVEARPGQATSNNQGATPK